MESISAIHSTTLRFDRTREFVGAEINSSFGDIVTTLHSY